MSVVSYRIGCNSNFIDCLRKLYRNYIGIDLKPNMNLLLISLMRFFLFDPRQVFVEPGKFTSFLLFAIMSIAIRQNQKNIMI